MSLKCPECGNTDLALCTPEGDMACYCNGRKHYVGVDQKAGALSRSTSSANARALYRKWHNGENPPEEIDRMLSDRKKP